MEAPKELVVTLAGIREAAARVGPHVHRTQVLTNTYLNETSGREVFFKCELFQKTGSFKARGACNAVLLTPPECRDIVTHSSGNHAQVRAKNVVSLIAMCTYPHCTSVVAATGTKNGQDNSGSIAFGNSTNPGYMLVAAITAVLTPPCANKHPKSVTLYRLRVQATLPLGVKKVRLLKPAFLPANDRPSPGQPA